MAQAVNCRSLIADDSLRSQSIPCEFVVYKVALWQVSLPAIRFSPVTTIPLMPHMHLHAALSRRTNWRNWKKKGKAVSEIDKH